MKYQINSRINFIDIEKILTENIKLELSSESKNKILKCRNYLDNKISTADDSIYGINTGFGALHNKRISRQDLNKLQRNLVMSHACGVGEEVPLEIVKLMLLLKIHGLSLGHSGVQLKTVERLIDFYNYDVFPVIYQLGSLGASGDLAPLAHLAMPLIGLGQVYYKNKKTDAANVLKKLGWKPIELMAKEGLALLNGTQFMSAYASWIIIKAKNLSYQADITSAISLDAFDCKTEPFSALVHSVRPHKGQIETAKNISEILQGSGLAKRKKTHTQDPYSFRCIPQVHGASKDVIEFAEKTFLIEINSVTDNPTIFPDEDEIISAGNFHGQPLALAFDSLCMAIAELGSISERRIYKLLSGQRELPIFLVENSGLNSGLMIPQYVAASIVSQNKQLCTPSSVDSIDSSNGQEDHVSMGANGATKCYRVIENTERILSMELFTAAQALDFRRPLKSSPQIEKIVIDFRKSVSFLKSDRPMQPELNDSLLFLKNILIKKKLQ